MWTEVRRMRLFLYVLQMTSDCHPLRTLFKVDELKHRTESQPLSTYLFSRPELLC